MYEGPLMIKKPNSPPARLGPLSFNIYDLHEKFILILIMPLKKFNCLPPPSQSQGLLIFKSVNFFSIQAFSCRPVF